ncbi:hypothetical protein F2Q69_00043364 [Brassica cretica]|uniref:Uncharacterized protein n=1 Tax=Brassica cretica TaxID=69181 RepID=A0A8S9NE16_BRACR|nr:hypothetical protein F2Q69_00043364 [Brassica cretica]
MALVGIWPNGNVALGARGSIVGRICCREHDVSRCFSDHGGTLLMSWGSLPQLVSRVIDVLQRVEEEGLLGAKPCLGGCRIGRFPLVQAGYLIKGIFPFILRHDKSLGVEAGDWRQGPRPGERNPDPGVGTRNLDAGTRKPEAEVIPSWNIFPQQFGPYFLVSCLKAGNNTVFFIGLRELHRSIKFLIEFGVGRRLVAWAIKLPCP